MADFFTRISDYFKEKEEARIKREKCISTGEEIVKRCQEKDIVLQDLYETRFNDVDLSSLKVAGDMILYEPETLGKLTNKQRQQYKHYCQKSLLEYVISKTGEFDMLIELIDKYQSHIDTTTLQRIIENQQLINENKILLVQKICNSKTKIQNNNIILLNIFIDDVDVRVDDKINMINYIFKTGNEFKAQYIEIISNSLSSVVKNAKLVDKIIDYVKEMIVENNIHFNDDQSTPVWTMEDRFNIINKIIFTRRFKEKSMMDLVDGIMPLFQCINPSLTHATIITYYVLKKYCNVMLHESHIPNALAFLYNQYKYCPTKYFSYVFDCFVKRFKISLNQLKDLAVENAIKNMVNGVDRSFIDYLLTIEDFGLEFSISSNNVNWYFKLIQNSHLSFDQKLDFLMSLHQIKKLEPNFMIEFYNISLILDKALLFYDNIITMLTKFMKLNTQNFDFLHCKDSDGKNIIDVLEKIKHKKPLSIIRMYNVQAIQDENNNNNDTEKPSLCVICMNNKVNTCIKKCGHASFCSDCVNNGNKCPMCNCDYKTKDLIKIYLP